MTANTSSESMLDLRASLFTRLHKRVGTEWLRVTTLVLVDATLLALAWQIAETYGADLDSPWNTQHYQLAIVPIVATEMGLIAAE